jgi:general secretion pathway protein D
MFLRLVIASVLSFAGLHAATLSVTPAAALIGINQALNLDVKLIGVTDLYAYQFDLKFDPTVLEALSVSEGSYLSNGGPTLFFPGSVDNVGGIITFTADTLEGLSGVSGSGTLASFSFEAITVGSSSIEIQNVVLLDSTLAGIAYDVSGGGVAVVAPEPSEAPVLLVFGVAGILLGRLRRSAGPRSKA